MRDSLGGLVNIIIILVFIVFAMGYIAYNVNYTKAFRMKDKIINTFNKYGGSCDDLRATAKTDVSTDIYTGCITEIADYADEIGYSDSFFQPDLSALGPGYEAYNHLFAFKKVVESDTYTDGEHRYDKQCVYYTIVTKMDMSLPIIDKFFSFKFLYINGDTEPVCS